VAPAGTLAPVITRLNAELAKILAAPELRDTFAKQGADAAGGSPDEFAAFMREEQARWGVVVREAGIKAD
jgi:tripartite-type tricarboxylate transporter receptor subunit TctC